MADHLNRYMVEGILDDIITRRRVAILTAPVRVNAWLATFSATAEKNPAFGFKVYRANGRERVEHASGGVVYILRHASELRGMSVDVLIFDRGVTQDEFETHALPCVAAGDPGEVMR